jgi:hypothetical protein
VPERPAIQPAVVAGGALLLAAGLWVLAGQGWRMPALLAIGALLGIALYHAAFGFTAAYRRAIVHREVGAVSAQLVMLAVGTALFAPTLAEGSIFGFRLYGAIAPAGVQVAVGAFMFGIGMQLGNGCGSGTLFTLGGGSVRMLATLVAFVAGSFWASLHMQWWAATPRLPEIVLGEELGWSVALVLQLVVLALIWLLLKRWGRSSRAGAEPGPVGWRRFVTGGWPFLWGALALAVLNWLTLIVAGHAWSITWAFTLWGAKAAQLLGWDPAGSWFWTGGFTERALKSSVLEDTVSVMNVGIMIGALVAAGLAGRYAPKIDFPPRSLVAAVIGGLLLGYGARIAFGCNIGAFFSGVVSTSLHGWLWIAAALPGTWIGVKLRPFFGLSND